MILFHIILLNLGTIFFLPQKIRLKNKEYFFSFFENLSNYLFLSMLEDDAIQDTTEKQEEDKLDKKCESKEK